MRIQKTLRFLLDKRKLTYFYKMSHDGYLFENGWMKSFELGRPVDQEGEPVPWLTLPFLKFIEPRLSKEMRVLEYGSGNSTLYYSTRVREVVSVESDRAWFEEVSSKVDPDAVSIYWKQSPEYAVFANSLGKTFDLIVVDGLDRFECAREAVGLLSSAGVVVLDNSVRTEYRPIYDLFEQAGFRHIDFFGMAPGSRKDNGTTVFYRPENCLGI